MLYHYTSIGTLALILQNKTIKFSRIDCVDDPEECFLGLYDSCYAKYVFLTCWTDTPNESLAMWELYGDKQKGVRVGLEQPLFNLEEVERQFSDISWGNLIKPLPNFMPQSVSYVSNAKDKYRKILADLGGGQSELRLDEVGSYKSEDWSFQHERRFKLAIIPPEARANKFFFDNPTGLKEKEIYVPLTESALKSLKVTLGPLAGASERQILSCILKKFCPNDSYTDSTFKRMYDCRANN